MAATPEQDAAQKEAHEYWGYMFKPDKTGTDKLKNLLRGLHHIIGTEHEPYDSGDLTPAQLAHFYRALNGNFDPLFLSTPPATIAFIYKNLGCLHSLQPLHPSVAENRFSEPTIPALKVEGWIMWQTIQLLLGPEEHATFMMQAVQKWDVTDPDTGEVMPKILPRSCFPAVPDSHMVAWYEGVSERLRREAEEEQSMRINPVDEEPSARIEPGDKHPRRRERADTPVDTDDEAVDSRRSAIAYFRNPLFRTVDGRPGVVRRTSRHPATSPRGGTLMQRGKSAATSVGHVVRNIGSPHLWDGHGSRERDKDRDRRRRSFPHTRRHSASDPDYEDSNPSPRRQSRHAAGHSHRNSPLASPSEEGYFHSSDISPRHTSSEGNHERYNSHERKVRHSKSHEPAVSPREYFPPYETYSSRRNSAQPSPQSPAPQQHDGITQAGFGPSASPLFATTVARSTTINRGDRRGYHEPQLQASQRRDDYRREDASPMGRRTSRDDGGRRDDSRRRNDERSHHTRPKVTRFEDVNAGVHGRQYVNEGVRRQGRP